MNQTITGNLPATAAVSLHVKAALTRSGRYVLTLLLCVLTTATAWADYSGNCGTTDHESEVTWSFNSSSKTLTISGTGAMADFSTYSDQPWRSYSSDITGVVVKEGVTHLGDRAFQELNQLQHLTIGKDVETIGNYVCQNCTLRVVTIPAKVTAIGKYAFSSNYELDRINVLPNTPPSLGGNAFDGCSSLTSIYVPSAKVSSYQSAWSAYSSKITALTNSCGSDVNWLYDNGNLYITGTGAMDDYNSSSQPWSSYRTQTKNIIVSDGVTHIGSYAFQHLMNPDLTITFGKDVQSIGDYACQLCSLKVVTIPASVTAIGEYAFADNYNLSKVYVLRSASVPTLGSNAFNDCSSSLSIYVPTTNYKTATNLSAYASKIKIGGICGASGDNATWIYSNGTLTIAGTGAMADYTTPSSRPWNSNASNIKNAIVGDGITRIGNSAFRELTLLHNLTIGKDVKTIGNYVCKNCTLEVVTIPVSVRSIGTEAFANNYILNRVYVLNTTPPMLGDDAFNNTGSYRIVTPAALVDTYKGASGWSNYPGKIEAGYTVTCNDGITATTYQNGPLILQDETVTLNYGGPVPDGYVSVVEKNGYNPVETVDVTVSGTKGTFLMPDNDVTASLKKDFSRCTATVPHQSLAKFNPATNSFCEVDKIHIMFENYPALVCEEVKDGETTLTLNTDYRFGTMTYASPDIRDYNTVDNDKTGDVCCVEIIGMGDYSGTKYVNFEIIDPNGTWGNDNELAWSLSGSAFDISLTNPENGNKAMKTAANYGQYPWAYFCNNVTSITIGEGITSIANYAFGRTSDINTYSNVTTLSLPSTLTIIGTKAFTGCTRTTINLDNILTIPNNNSASISDIGPRAFSQVGCLVGSLNDTGDNSDILSLMSTASSINVTLSGRTLWRDGDWNTLCLPFALGDADAADGHHFDGTPLDGATVKELDGDNSNLTDGTLTMNFKDATAIEAGKPYLVKWTDTGANIVDPVFTGVITAATPSSVSTKDRKVTFTGTYNKISYTEEDPSILILGADNTLFWPESGASIGAFRAYFKVSDTSAAVRTFNLSFGEQENAIVDVDSHSSLNTHHSSLPVWYTLNGVKLDKKPTRKGMYIVNGRKVAIK